MSAEHRDSSSGRRPKPIAISVDVPTDDLGYSVLVGPGMFDRVAAQLRRLHPAAQRVALVSDQNVMPLYGFELREQLQAAEFEVHDFVVPPGEESKCQARLFELVEGFIQAGLSRRDVVVPLGGGVVGDLAGLAAATFMRGISFLQVPTSLLAQVDSSVGGKVAIDIPGGKNLFGAFHFPTAVIIDPRVLCTLDDRELGCGLAEMIKHAALFSAEHFVALTRAAEAIYARDLELLGRLSATSVAYKAACVGRDPLEHAEAGKGRVLLNLGHTVGHAIESMSNFECKHGEAVALGLRAAARISERCGIAPAGLEERMVEALRALRLPTDLDTWLGAERRAEMLQYLGRDKKRRDHKLSYIALAGLGDPRVLPLSSEEIVNQLVS